MKMPASFISTALTGRGAERPGVDVIVTHFTQTTRAAMAATKTVPIVMVVGAPVQGGFAQSLASPGGNATGLSGMDSELAGKCLQMLRELVPIHVCVAILGTTPATNPYSGPFLADLQTAAAKVDVHQRP